MSKANIFRLFITFFLFIQIANAQLLKKGQAVTTFSYISNPLSYVLSVYDVRGYENATPGQNWNATVLRPLTHDSLDWKLERMGDVFGVTIDSLANIYVAATSVYGAVTFGTAGSGGIYKVNATDWSVSDFIKTDANPVYNNNNKIPNLNSGLGNICYDKWHNQLFVTNFEDGKIYRIAMNGNILDSFDPFLPDNSVSGPVDHSERTWGVDVYGTNATDTRLYFSRWNSDLMSFDSTKFNEIWSVGLAATGNFNGVESLEIQIPHLEGMYPYSGPVASINFSADGKMLLAERTMAGFNVTAAHQSRVLQYKRNNQTWSPPQVFYIGMIGFGTNAAGGADYGYGAFDDASNNSYECDSMIWATGDALKFDGMNPDGSHDVVYGIAGIPSSGNSFQMDDDNYIFNTNYCIDTDGDIVLQAKSVQGCIKVFRNCPPHTVTEEPPVIPVPECVLPNVITPNMDGDNDTFQIPCMGSYPWQLIIYNRWGQVMYQSNNYQNNWQADDITNGTYYYIAINSSLGENHHGFFQVIKN